jgi:hypothetical protein
MGVIPHPPLARHPALSLRASEILLDVADVVATVSVLSTAAVALGSAIITAVSSGRRERTLFRSETRRDREDELRDVAEDAAMKMSNAIYQLDRVRGKFDDGPTDLGPLYEAYGEIWNSENRLAIRLGNNAPEVVCYRAALDHVAIARDLVTTADHSKISEFVSNRESAFGNQKKFRDLISKRLSPDQ